MSSSPYRLPLALPRVVRDEREGAVAGVCAGIARSLDVDATVVRLGFSLLALAGGAGIVAYVGAWLALPADEERAPSHRRRLLGLVLLVVAAALALRGLGLGDALVWPAAFVGVGIFLTRRGNRSAALGLLLVAIGVLVFVDQNAGDDSQNSLLEPSAVAVALLLVVGPWAWRVAVERDAERTARIRSQERAEMAARIHDSVLQTLALVQRESGDPRRVAALARRQERELRGWLYPDPQAAAGGLAAAIDAAAAEVEELHGVPVELVRTGDAPFDDRAEALVLAAREAMANAARHSGTDEISVFVDIGADELAVYVRDRGRGFDPDAAAAPGHGIEESIRGRMTRAGGTAAIDSSPEGTEVELRVRRRP